eukprot:3460710-Rhodomonas_salina.1
MPGSTTRTLRQHPTWRSTIARTAYVSTGHGIGSAIPQDSPAQPRPHTASCIAPGSSIAYVSTGQRIALAYASTAHRVGGSQAGSVGAYGVRIEGRKPRCDLPHDLRAARFACTAEKHVTRWQKHVTYWQKTRHRLRKTRQRLKKIATDGQTASWAANAVRSQGGTVRDASGTVWGGGGTVRGVGVDGHEEAVGAEENVHAARDPSCPARVLAPPHEALDPLLEPETYRISVRGSPKCTASQYGGA